MMVGLRQSIEACVFELATSLENVVSATITGSFLSAKDFGGLSDIDLVVIVDHLDGPSFAQLVSKFATALRPVLDGHGLRLIINTKLGPIKCDEPGCAVLHLMTYSVQSHIDHVIDSPFTCFDWQLSRVYCKRPIEEIYPVFALQPRHFFGSRRGLLDYLADWNNGVVSYREYSFAGPVVSQDRHTKPMNTQDRIEFAFHLVRFLMRNIIKLLHRTNDVPACALDLSSHYVSVFPHAGDAARGLFIELSRLKAAKNFESLPEHLDARLRQFIADFELQFRNIFDERASRHIVIRHAPVMDVDHPLCFLGKRSDPPILPNGGLAPVLMDAVESLAPRAAFSSPLARCQDTISPVAKSLGISITTDPRLVEIDYGACDGLEVEQARQRFPELFAAWSHREDPRFPGGGENSEDVAGRILDFAREHWTATGPSTLTCTHNVVIRALLGKTMGLNRSEWHKLTIPYLSPITFVQTERFGLYADLSPTVERTVFRAFADENGN